MKKVLLLLANGFEMYEAAVFSDVFGFAQTGGSDIRVQTMGLHKTLTCTYNFTVIPELVYPDVDLEEFDALAISGGRRDAGFLDDAYSPQFQEIINKFANGGKIIAAICMGVMPIAKSGLLKGRSATTYPGKRQEELKQMGINVKNLSIVIDNNFITSSSPSTGLDVAFTLLEKLTDKESMERTRCAFGFWKK